MNDSKFHPDPRTKLALLVFWTFAVFFSPGIGYEIGMMLLGTLFGVLSGKARLSVGMLGVYAVSMCFLLLFSTMEPNLFTTTVASFLYMMRKVLPCALLASIIVASTHFNEFMAALSHMHCPRQISIPLAVMLRYLPAIREDWNYIKDAMRMRGVNPSVIGFVRRPGLTVECLYVPLLMSGSAVADELSMAAVARGIENPAPRSCYAHIEFGWHDTVVVILGVVVLIGAITLNAMGIRL